MDVGAVDITVDLAAIYGDRIVLRDPSFGYGDAAKHRTVEGTPGYGHGVAVRLSRCKSACHRDVFFFSVYKEALSPHGDAAADRNGISRSGCPLFVTAVRIGHSLRQ